VGNGRIRLVQADDDFASQAEPGDEARRRAARQQEAVAYLGQRALAGASVATLTEEAVVLLARALEVECAALCEFRAESRTLLLRAGVGWRAGCVGRMVLPADADTHGGYALRSPIPVVVEDLPRDARFARAPLLSAHGIVSGIAVAIQGKERPFGVLGAHSRRSRDFTARDAHFIQGMAHVLATAIDRARTEEALRASAEQFRSLIENASDIVTIVGDDGILRYASPSVERLLGYAPAELLERNLFELLHPDDVAGLADALGRARAAPGVPQSAAFRFRHRDGGWRMLESVGQARRDHGGAATFVVNSRDVTERRAQELALGASRERLRTLVASAPLVLFTLDPAGVFTLVEGKGLDALGVRPGRLVGQSVFQMYADEPETLADVRRALAGESFTSTVEVFGLVFEVSYSPLRDADQRLAGVIGVATDITERRRAEEALRRSEESHRALVEHAAYGIYRSARGRFLSANPALVAMLGYDSEADLLAVDLERDVYADPAERAGALAQLASADRVQDLEVTWRRKDGARIVVRLSGRAVRAPDGRIDSCEMVVEDVTDRRALEEQVRQSQKIEALGRLTGGIAHDFNNLLTIILANAELIRRSLDPAGTAEQADLRDLVAAALRGRVMIKELLGFARRSSLDLQAVDLGHVAGTLSGMLRRVLPADIELRVTAEDAPAVRADVHAVEQILFNLVTNARDAMPDGGTLRIATGRSRLAAGRVRAAGVPPVPEWAYLRVEDAGVGMDAATRQRMFEPFFTTKPSGEGTGLGMATVYGLAKQHGAVIEVDSAPGQGTRVTVHFPALRTEAPAAAVAPGAEAVPRGGQETILVVEDEGDLRRAAKRVLEQAGYQVLTAADGQEALEAIRQQASPIHLVLSDLVMPRPGGRGLYDAVRREGHQTPFLFASGYSPDEGRGGVGATPGASLLSKPWTPADLLMRVREVLDRA
jgi:PAS domain S-box-containing protein